MTLLFAIVIVVSVTVVVVGAQALEDRQQATSMESVRASFQRLDADLAQVVSGSKESVSMANLGDGRARVQSGKGNVTVQITDPDGASPTNRLYRRGSDSGH
uniref:hypothetical protein n=1 Tax=Halomicrobium urmianum TaxID=1586233 RepID=UPI001CD94CDD|nr:hypothetical protein [Halomicrobium urmianum]